MRGLRKVLFSISCLVSIVVCGIIFTGNVDAASPKVEYLGQVRYGDYIVGKFKVNGEIAFCVDHAKPTPPTGASYGGGNAYKNEKIRAILYYGYGGPGNELGNSDVALVATSIALDSIMNGNYSSGRDSIPGYKKLMKHAEAKDAPSTSIGFNKKNVTSKVSGSVQKSETVVFKADSKNSIKLNVPAGVTLHKGAKKYSGKNVTIKGGESFYLTAPLDYGKTVKFHNVKPSIGKYQSILFISSSSTYQRLGSGLLTDPEPVTDLNIKFEVRQRKISVEHIDKYTNKVLEKENFTRNIGTDYSFKPKSSIVKNGDKFVPVNNKNKTGTVGNKDVTIKIYYNLQRKVTIEHIDARDNRTIKTESDLYLRGEKYSYKPRNDLKKGDYTYRPISTAAQSGEIGSKNITLKFYYDVPLIKVELEKLQIYTDLAREGLPVKLKLAKTNIYKNNTKGMATAGVKVNVYQGKSLILTKKYTAQTLPKSSDLKIPSSKLKVNENKPYTVKLEGYNKDDIDVVSYASTLTTNGYTSSEDKFTIDMKDITKDFGSVKRVVMTEITPTTPMKSYYETLKFKGQLLNKIKTGYGSEQNLKFSYENMIKKDDDKITFNFNVPEDLMDTYLNYGISEGLAHIPMNIKSNKKSESGDLLVRDLTFVFPHVNVEKETGSLFTDEQVKNNDKRIQKEVRDGGNKFYTPIWSDLGDYNVEYASDPVGINRVRVVITDDLKLYAYMIAHMDSKTKSQDEILLTPINADDPFPNGVPEGWTKSDLDWLKK